MGNNNEPTRVELYVRSLAPSGARDTQEAIIDRLLDLEQNGAVDDLGLTVWGNAVCLDAASARVGVGSRVAERVRAFQRWCENRRASLEPFFTWSSVDSSITGDSFHRVVPPHRCLAIYVGDELQDLYPCIRDGDVRSIEDGLQRLERRRSQYAGSIPLFEEVS